MDILNGLNDVQKQALLETRGAVLVTAGAGSGKTKLLTHRIAYLVKDLNVDVKNIIAITFTNKAAKEMKERVDLLVGRPNNIWISTIHSMCLKILRSDIAKLGTYSSNFTIYSESDSEKALKSLLKDKGYVNDDYKRFSFHISNCLNKNLDVVAYAKSQKDGDEIIQIYDAYENMLKQNNAMDFDHLLSVCYELLATNKEVLQKYAERFEYIFVDEFQDTNKVQYDIIKLLASVNHNIFVVGDEDQCIYTWRGADFQNIFDFKTDFAPVKMFKLEQNYRSTKAIIELSNKLIKNNTERFDKVLWTDNEEGKKVEYYEQYDEQTEADSVVSKIYTLVRNGYNYSDIAILMRINALTLPFEQKLLAYNLPYKIYGGFKFYERQEIKNIICYLNLFCNPSDNVAFSRIINFPKRGIGDGAIDKMKIYAHSLSLSLLPAMQHLCENKNDNPSLYLKIHPFIETYNKLSLEKENLDLDDFVDKVINDFQIKSAYDSDSEEDMERIMNIEQLSHSLTQFTEENEGATLNNYLENITLESDLDYMGEFDTITMSTVHSVKGLEFKVVFIIGLEDGIFPISRAFDIPKEIEEERRLMYVAMTRAKERLFLSNASTRYLHGKRNWTTPSRFLGEMELGKKRPVENNDSYGYFPRRGNFINNSYCGNTTTIIKQPIETENTRIFNITKPPITNSITDGDNKSKKDLSIYCKGQKVMHPKFGKGEISAIVDDGVCAEIIFENFGKKTLLLEIAPLEILK